METIGVSKLRENLLFYMNKVQQGQSITITSCGNKIAMLVPFKNETETSRIALRNLRKTAYVRDIVSPIEELWKAIS